MRQLLEASGHRGVYIPGNRGRLLDLFSPKAILSTIDEIEDFGDQSIQVFVEPAQISDIIDERVQCAIAEEFQPQLLFYRLKHCAKIQVIEADVPEFAVATRQLASNLAACFSDDLELAKELVSLLGSQDQDLRAKQTGDIEYAILSVLLGLIHEGKLRRIPAAKIAQWADALQRSKGQVFEYSAEEVGWKLRAFNVCRHRTSSGSVIKLDSETRRQVHRLARRYGLLSKIPGGEQCPECAAEPARSKGVVAV
jgi:hypothetical protein